MAGFFVNLTVGVCKAVFILRRFQPDVIIGTGSYAAAPVLIAAAILKKIGLLKSRVFLHEQNAVPGKLNRVMARFADKVLVAFPETLNCFQGRSELAGYPLRRRIAAIPRPEALQKIDCAIPDGRRVVFAFGGSQGARVMNRALADALKYLIPYRDRLYIIHGVGLYKSQEYDAAADTGERLRQYDAAQLADMESFYTWRPYFHDIQNLYSVSDLVVVRGGAGSLSEISAMSLPALIIPKANLPGNHQVMNARAMERAGCAEILYEQASLIDGRFTEYIDGKVLADKIVSLALDDARLQKMRSRSRSFLNLDALSRIASAVLAETPRSTDQKTAAAPASAAFEDKSLTGNNRLLNLLEKEYKKDAGSYKVSSVIAHAEDVEYFKSRAGALLISPEWQKRNLGVKLLGLLEARESIPVMLAMLKERKRVSIVKRLFGGDFEQVGFIRRNIVITLVRLDTLTPEVESAFLDGFSDPYYEVRTECAKAAAHFNERIAARDIFIAELMKILNESNLDVSTAAAEALGRLGGEHNALPALLNLRDTKYWRLRAAALKGIFYLVERGCIADLKTLKAQAPQFILTSTDFKPHFEIKHAYQELMKALSGKKETNLPQ
jgi:UDP-N-acetylglucosamine--N-acetylmuramyl-(pentapeptide) pyrophosphoryl-undecaprenol N-acetylglucosamine transferase